MPKTVTIGGGTGAPVIIKALALAGVKSISAISTATDSGGKTGIIRSDERDRVIAVSDLLRNLTALTPPRLSSFPRVAAFTDACAFTDGRNRNLGYTFYYALLEKYSGDFRAVQSHLETMLGIRFNGTAIPVTTTPTNICFSTQSGQTYLGEHELDSHSMSTSMVTKIWLEKPVPATSAAVAAIRSATHIFFCPGSLYGSVLVNLLPTGIRQALARSRARKVYVSNLVSDRNQTHNFTPLDFYRIFQKYTRLPHPFDFFICPRIARPSFETLHPKIAANYASEHSHFLGWDHSRLSHLESQKVKVISQDIFSITSHMNRLRHDPHKLAKVFKLLYNT